MWGRRISFSGHRAGMVGEFEAGESGGDALDGGLRCSYRLSVRGIGTLGCVTYGMRFGCPVGEMGQCECC